MSTSKWNAAIVCVLMVISFYLRAKMGEKHINPFQHIYYLLEKNTGEVSITGGGGGVLIEHGLNFEKH